MVALLPVNSFPVKLVLEIFSADRFVLVEFPTTSVVSVAFPPAISAFVKLVVPVAVMFVVEREFSCEV